MKKPKKPDLAQSSAAEYLTYVIAAGDTEESFDLRYEDETLWMTQRLMAALYDITVQGIGQHIKQIYADGELLEEATIKKFLIVQQEGTRQVTRQVAHYNLKMIIAVGFKVNSPRAVQFRKWANAIIQDFTVKGWAMDEERLKNGGSRLTERYFDELLQKIREIRLSERRFYQKVTDIYATALDYDPSAEATRTFFAAVQNKLHYAITGQTAAELIYHRADASKPHMGLTNWKDAPEGKIQKYDVGVAKDYLTEDELTQLSRIVSAYLDYAEDQAKRHIPMTMADWATRLDAFLTLWGRGILKGNGSVSMEAAKLHAETEFEKYRRIQDRNYRSDFDRFLEETEGKDLPPLPPEPQR